MAARRDLAISVEGLRDLRRALKHTDGNLDRNVRGSLREIGDEVRDLARGNARGLELATGELAKTIRTSVTQRHVSIRSTLEYAPVVEYGRLRYARFKGRFFMRDAVREAQPRVTRQLEQLLDDIADDYDERT